MKIIEDMAELEQLRPTQSRYRDIIVVPVLSDPIKHPAVNSICMLHITILSSPIPGQPDYPLLPETYILPFHHNDAKNLPETALIKLWNILLGGAIYTPSKKLLLHVLHGRYIDVDGMEYFNTGTITSSDRMYSDVMRQMYSVHRDTANINQFVPLMKLIEYCDNYVEHIKKIITLPSLYGFAFFNDTELATIKSIEANGIHVDSEKFVTEFGKKSQADINDSIVYSEYNPYTLTGRITNHFHGVNYSALKPSQRTAFTSRFENGNMVMFDYVSFHPLIIASLIGFKFPEPVYQYLGKQYFKTSTLTTEQYQQAKTMTMRYLYGETHETGIAFFDAVYKYIDQLWEKIQSTGSIVSPTGRKIYLDRITEPTKQKIFNYLLQLREMEITMIAISKLNKIYSTTESKIILYTYDSILIDFNADVDTKQLLQLSQHYLSHDGKFPVRCYMGDTYANIKEVNLV